MIEESLGQHFEYLLAFDESSGQATNTENFATSDDAESVTLLAVNSRRLPLTTTQGQSCTKHYHYSTSPLYLFRKRNSRLASPTLLSLTLRLISSLQHAVHQAEIGEIPRTMIHAIPRPCGAYLQAWTEFVEFVTSSLPILKANLSPTNGLKQGWPAKGGLTPAMRMLFASEPVQTAFRYLLNVIFADCSDTRLLESKFRMRVAVPSSRSLPPQDAWVCLRDFLRWDFLDGIETIH